MRLYSSFNFFYIGQTICINVYGKKTKKVSNLKCIKMQIENVKYLPTYMVIPF